jgi:hypothetical protein
MNKKFASGLILAFLLFSLSSFADDRKPGSGWAVDVKAGSLGIGGDLSRSIVPRVLNLRVGASFFKYSADFDSADVTYGAQLKLGAVPIGVDVFPLKNWLRLGGGILINLNEMTGTARPTGGTIKLGDTTYNLTDLGQVEGKVKFNRTAPFFGLGFNNPIKKEGHLGFFADLGFMYHGDPTASLTATKPLTSRMQQDLDKQILKTNNDIKDFNLFPIIQLGLSYKF